MTRLFWGILALILVGGAIFTSMLRFGGPDAPASPAREIAAIPDAPPAGDGVRWTGGLLTVPVAGVERSAIASSWGDPRGQGTRLHRGNDIMAPGGTPVLAAADGVVEKVFWSAGGGGNTLYIRSPDGRWSYYYAHLAAYAPGIAEGVRVRAGQPIAAVGDTGNARPGNTHLHFGLSAMAPGERWWQGRAVDPTPLLTGSAD
ncbi:peptidase M23 [Sphingomonas spermidinifaciens]|uniref:Peptidase M23 n=1 Tax=Sphingomonas spermidinifaciens TaxID=1141889 RepID=A0A2A4B7V9_9SPHN|nr:M23 family metallopeptidase [Sphingomonas spermidinifaciens]PCD04005.1 peptidase M23 [Sphingomonas spermidinifaciens]